MNIVAVSDIHLGKNILTKLLQAKGDMLLVCGDFSDTGSYKEICAVLDIISQCSFKYIIVIAGNHDIDMEANFQRYKDEYPNVIFLNNEVIEVEGIKIYGSPYCKKFGDWAFSYEDRKNCIRKTLPKEKVDIIICHEPPYDKDLGFFYDTHYGNFPLRVLLEMSDKAPQLLLCGHIHENGGEHKLIGKTQCYNCAKTIIEYEFKNRD